jgi:NitT/TauT family transport system substrate-binding protein
MKTLTKFALGIATAAFAPSQAAAAPKYDTVNMTVDEEPIVMALAQSLGCLDRERIKLNVIDIMSLIPNDYQMQVPLQDGRVDVAYHWFNHAVFGARHKMPVIGVMNFNDAPGMTVLVAKAKAGEIKAPADFKGRTVASGALYGTKSLLSYSIASKAGLGLSDYRHAAVVEEGREAAIKAGLADNSIDLVTSEEPYTARYKVTGLVQPLYLMTDRASTVKTLGAEWPAQSLLMAPKFIAAKPEVAQRVVNAFVCTMRFINKSSIEQIAAKLPASYFAGKDRAEELTNLANELPTFAKGNYRVDPQGAALVAKTIPGFDFGKNEEGVWRNAGGAPVGDPTKLYDNRFVDAAMKRVK